MSYLIQSRRVRSFGYAFVGVILFAACGSSDVPIGEQDLLRASDGGAGTNSTTGGSSGSSGGEVTGSSGSGVAGTSTTGGGAGSSSAGGSSGGTGSGGATGTGGSMVVDAGSCGANFTTALVKDCNLATDCVLVKHNDCCGNVVVAIRSGTDSTFTAAEQAFQTCVPGCGLRGCFHADMAEDGKSLGTVGDAFVAQCQNKRCSSVVSNPISRCIYADGSAVGQCATTGQSCVWNGSCDPGPNGPPPNCGFVCVNCKSPPTFQTQTSCAQVDGG